MTALDWLYVILGVLVILLIIETVHRIKTGEWL